MSIREQEDKLFSRWRKKYNSFVIDGLPSEEHYLSSKIKTVVVLKDINAPDIVDGVFNLRHQLENVPHHWWETVSAWCAGMSKVGYSEILWSDLYIRGNPGICRDRLKNFGIIQIKKSCGVGHLDNKSLWSHAELDAIEIQEQLNMYLPEIIVGAGVGPVLASIIGEGVYKSTSRGVPYSIHFLAPDRPTFLIHYVHPSARAPKNLLCFGLLDAYAEIVDIIQNSA